MSIFPASLLCDFYKVSHREQYPENTELVFSTWTPRRSLLPGYDHVIAFGFQGFVKKYLVNYFNKEFFGRPKRVIADEYKRFIENTLGTKNPDTAHIEALHDLGYLPIEIRAVAEGARVPLRVPMLTIRNTDPRFFWLTNYLETLMSCCLWQPSTSATIAAKYREILDTYAAKTSDTPEAVNFQAHDFSMRGMGGVESAVASGAGHLLSFTGTDTIPAIAYLEEYYNANIEKELVGASIPATEHSVMCANGQDELASYKRLITEVYPKGFVSIVSDTWDFWKVVTETLPKLKEDIMNRDGRVVIRPDSGDPVKIICGDINGTSEASMNGLVETLWNIFGGTTNSKGYKVLDPHIGAIYGDSITTDRAEEICRRLEMAGFASTNVVFGVGSFSYQYSTRDTFGFALKSTYCVVNGEERQIFKDPKTDTSNFKKSQRGLVSVVKKDNEFTLIDGMNREQHDKIWSDELRIIFKDGSIREETSLAEIRKTLAS